MISDVSKLSFAPCLTGASFMNNSESEMPERSRRQGKNGGTALGRHTVMESHWHHVRLFTRVTHLPQAPDEPLLWVESYRLSAGCTLG